METKIYREDDLSIETKGERLKRFKAAHALLVKYNVLHTVALICHDIEKNKALVRYMQAEVKRGTMSVQVHCWDHVDLTIDPSRLLYELPLCIQSISELFGQRPTTLFPPWNRSNEMVEEIAKANGLKVSNKKMSLSGYLKGQNEDVINWHSWADEIIDLEAALKKYTTT